MPPDDGEWSFCQQWSGPPTTQEVEVSCSIRMLAADTTKPADNMNRVLSSSTKQYSFITRSPRICRSKSMTREYIYFPIISSKPDNLSKSWLRNVKSLSSLQGKDEKQMINEKLKNRESFLKNQDENEISDAMYNEDEYRDTLLNTLSPSPPRFERNRLTASDRNIGYRLKATKTRKKSLSNEELNTKELTGNGHSPNLCEDSENLSKNQRKPGKKMKRSVSLRAWNPPSIRKPVLSSFKSDYNVLQPKTVVSLSHQFETTPLANKPTLSIKKKIELYDKSEMKKRRRIQTEPVPKNNVDNNTKIRANSLPDESICKKIDKTEISPKSVKKLKSDWEKKLEESLSKSRPTSPNQGLSSHNDSNRKPSYEENFIQSARQIQVLREYKQRASTSVTNLKNQFEVFATPSPTFLDNSEGSNKSNKLFQYEKCIDETPAERIVPKIVTSSIKSIRLQFEQQSLTKKEDSSKLKPTRNNSPSKSTPILNLLAKFDPSVSCSSQGRDSTTSNGSFSDNDVFAGESSHGRNEEVENDIFVSKLKEKKVQVHNYLKQLEKEKEEELRRLKEQRDRDAIMAEKREVERQKKIEEEKIKEQREKEREQERRRIEAEREIQRKRLKEEKKNEEIQRSIDKEKQRLAIEEEVKRAKQLRDEEQRKEIEEREKLELKRIEEAKEIEEFEREKLLEARERMEAELQKEKDEKLKAEEEKLIKLQIERGIYSENDASEGVALEADVDNLINKFEKSPRENELDVSPRSEYKPLSRGGSTQSLSNCRPLNPDEMQLFMGMTTSESFMRTQSLRVKPKKNARESRMKRSNSMSEKSSPMLIPNKPRTSMGPPVVKSVPSNCRQLRPEEWKFFLGDMTSSKECDFDFSDSE